MRYLILCLIILGFTQCKIENKEVKGKPTIVCTTSISADLVKQITGDNAEVSYLMGPGVDPHEYSPKLSDSEKLLEADIIVYHGLNLEGKMSDDLEKARKNKKIVINLSEKIDHASLIHLEEDHVHADGETHAHEGEVDPHMWHDARLWIQAANHLAASLGKYNKENKDSYLENASNYSKELIELDDFLVSKFKEIPDSQRVLVTAHDAFGYLCKRYNIRSKSLQGISTAAEFGIKDVTDLANYLIRQNIKSIFIESSVPNKNLQAVIDHCAEKGHKVSIGGILFSDALGDRASGADTYDSMMRSNANTIVNGLSK